MYYWTNFHANFFSVTSANKWQKNLGHDFNLSLRTENSALFSASHKLWILSANRHTLEPRCWIWQISSSNFSKYVSTLVSIIEDLGSLFCNKLQSHLFSASHKLWVLSSNQCVKTDTRLIHSVRFYKFVVHLIQFLFF